MTKKCQKIKYLYLKVVQGYYGHGWEDLCCSEFFKEARQNLKEYRDNEPEYPHRIIQRREKRDEP